MKPAPSQKPQPKPLIPSNRDEDILKAVYKYHFVTAQEITNLLYSKGSHTFVRERCTRLAGGQDYADRCYLYRFPFPSAKGNRERIYTLGSLGREILENLGLQVAWHFKPAKLRTYSHSHLLHSLTLSRTIAAFHAFTRIKDNITIESILSYELAKTAPVVSISSQGKIVKVAVVPDAQLLITNIRSNQRLLIILEIDHNTESQPRLRAHIAARLAYVHSPHFTNVYGNIPFRIVYATYGQTPSASQARLQSMCIWTSELLTALKKQEYARYFRFTTLNFATLYEDAQALFERPMWHRPDDPATPVPLLTG